MRVGKDSWPGGIELGVILCASGRRSHDIFDRFPVRLPQPSELAPGPAAAGRSYSERSTSYGMRRYDAARVPSGGGVEDMQDWRYPGGGGRNHPKPGDPPHPAGKMAADWPGCNTLEPEHLAITALAFWERWFPDQFDRRLPFPFELPPWWPDTPRFRQATANERRPPVSWPSLGGARDGGEWSDEEGERRPEGRDWVPGQETP